MFFGELARENYPEGVLVPWKPSSEEAAAETSALLERGVECLFEATFIFGNLVARADILVKDPCGGWIIHEVKSSSLKAANKLDSSKIDDLAFQLLVLRGAGLRVTKTLLVLVDTSQEWDGTQEALRRLLSSVDVTERCEKAIKEIEENTENLLGVMLLGEEPDVEINTHCKECDYAGHCLRDVSFDNVLLLPGITAKEVRRLREGHFDSIRSLPPDFKMTERRARARDALSSGRPYVSKGLPSSLRKLYYPVAFVDFETASSAVPLYPHTRPYQQICFQWSAHVAQSPQVLLEHYDFLARSKEDPRESFCRSLWEVVKDCNTIVHYTKFEITLLAAMQEQNIPLAKELHEAFVTRSFDLEKVVSEHVYFEGFRGRTTIKVVLPTLVPGMSYKHLRIGDGIAAANAFRRSLDPEEDPLEVEAIRTALLDYCCQDTLAMVEILAVLVNLVRDELGESLTFDVPKKRRRGKGR